MKYCLSFIIIILNLSLFGQQNFTPIDRQKVQKAVTDSKSPTAYKELVRRFRVDDSTLTLQDYRLLYYGYIFQKDFTSQVEEDKRAVNKAFSDKDYKKAIDICDSVLTGNPVSLFANYYKGFSMYMADKTSTEYMIYRGRFKHLAEAIVSSGDGLTCETGFRVNTVPDEYTMMYNYFNIKQFTGQALVSHCDRMNVKPSDIWPHELLYYDATEILKKEAELFGH